MTLKTKAGKVSREKTVKSGIFALVPTLASNAL